MAILHTTAEQTSGATTATTFIDKFRSMRGGKARFFAVLFLIGFAVNWPFEWHHDLMTTRDWFFAHPSIVGTVVATWGTAIGWLFLLGIPMLARAITGQFAAALWWALALNIAAEVFDAMTDWAASGDAFANWPMPALTSEPGAFAGWWVCRLLWAAMCTNGFELIMIGCFIGFVVCAWNSFRPAQ